MLPRYINSFDNIYTDATISNSSATDTAKIYFNKNLKINKTIKSSTDSSSGMYLDINDYSNINFEKDSYIISGNSDNWENTKVDGYFEVGTNYSFESVPLDSNYYVMFKIYDVDNLYTYSDLVQIK